MIDKENLAPVPQLSSSPIKPTTILSPTRSKRQRAQSLGNGALADSEPIKTKSPSPKRRESTIASYRSIIPSRDEELKRREARRKSLANRRVSFCPEATIHTLYDFDHADDATSTTASSEATRRASKLRHELPESEEDDAESDDDDADDQSNLSYTSPAATRPTRNSRRSSGVPPLDFNNPDEFQSSSPTGSDAPSDASESEDGSASDFDEDGATAMSIVTADDTTSMSLASHQSTQLSDSSARLEASLHAAASRAGTRGIDFDENGAMTMDPIDMDVEDGVDPWMNDGVAMTPMAKNLLAVQEQENINPFSPAFRTHVTYSRPSTIQEEDEDVSMDMTYAGGAILPRPHISAPAQDEDDQTMDFTQAVGQVRQPVHAPLLGVDATQDDDDQTMDFTQAVGRVRQPAHAPMPSADTTTHGNDTMDFTRAFGVIHGADSSPSKSLKRRSTTVISPESASRASPTDRPTKRRRTSTMGSPALDHNADDITVTNESLLETSDTQMDMTVAVGGIKTARSPSRRSRRSTVTRRRSSRLSGIADESAMDMTMVAGFIKPAQGRPTDPESHVRIQEQTAQNPSTPDASLPPVVIPSPVAQVTALEPLLVHPIAPTVSHSPQSASRTKTPSSGRSRHSRNASKESAIKSPVKPNHILDMPQTALQTSVDNLPSDVARFPPLSADPILQEAVALPQTPETKHYTRDTVSSQQRRVLQSPLQVQRSSEKKQSTLTTIPEFECSREIAGHALAENIRSLCTPKRQFDTTPRKRILDATPRRTPRNPALSVSKPMTPRTASRSVKGSVFATHAELQPAVEEEKVKSPPKPIQLQDFLQSAGLHFVDLATTKRRHTMARPTADHARNVVERIEDSIVSQTCTLPELDMYEYSYRVLNEYLTEGKGVMQDLEKQVLEVMPPFMQRYAIASGQGKVQLDEHISAVRSQARAVSKRKWYGWRSSLLEKLERVLIGHGGELELDGDLITERELLAAEYMPKVAAQIVDLRREILDLEDLVAATDHESNQELQERRILLAQLNEANIGGQEALDQAIQVLQHKEAEMSHLEVTKTDSEAIIKAAERTKEQTRAVSTDKIDTLQESIHQIQALSGWTLDSVRASNVTMSHMGQLQLFFDTSAFASRSTATRPRDKRENSPISLVYIAREDGRTSSALPTEKRFFLQMLQAHVQCMVQHTTSAKDLLETIATTWTTACTLTDTIERLEIEHPVDTRIQSDDTLGVQISMLLPKVQTRVCIDIEISAALTNTSTSHDDAQNGTNETGLDVQTSVRGRVVYGEQYKEQNMGPFIKKNIGHALSGWEVPVRELRQRLIARGKVE